MAVDDDKTDISMLRIRRSEEPESGRTIRWKTPLIAAGILILLVIAGYFAYHSFLTSTPEVELASASLTFPSQANAVLTASGYVVAQQKAAVASKGTGRLVYLGVEEGDKVKSGQVIARLEDQDMVAALAKARADLQMARADSFDAHQTFDRVKSLYDRSLTSQADLDAAAARLERVRASILSARAAVSAAQVGLENTRIRAPFNGTVLTKDADVGEVVAPFAAAANSRGAVVTMADMASLLVEADVSESNITRVRVGQKCDIVLDAYPDKRYPGIVHKIVPTADRAKATVLTKVKFIERDDRVLPEMSAKVTFLSPAADTASADNTPRLTVPSSSVVNRNGQNVVLLVREGRVTETPVRTGRTIGGNTEILEGVARGDQVVLRPSPEIKSGTKVKQRTS